MNREEFKKLRIGDYVQVTQHGQNKGKIGIVEDILRGPFKSRSVYLKPYECEFSFINKSSRRQKDGLTSFSYVSLRYLGKSPIVPEKVMSRLTFDDMESKTEKGRFILMAIAHITGTTHSDRTPQQTIMDLYDRYYDTMFGNEEAIK